MRIWNFVILFFMRMKISWITPKDLHNPDNHDGVIIHLEPDILECEVKWALEGTLQTKLVEVMEFQLSCFKSWKVMLWKCCTHYASRFGKLSNGHRTGKVHFSFQSQRKAVQKEKRRVPPKLIMLLFVLPSTFHKGPYGTAAPGSLTPLQHGPLYLTQWRMICLD